MDWIDVHGLDLFSQAGFVFTGWIRTLDLDLGLDIGHSDIGFGYGFGRFFAFDTVKMRSICHPTEKNERFVA